MCSILLTCDATYVRQTARCVNTSLTEQTDVRITAPDSEITRNLSDCEGSFPWWESCQIMTAEQNNLTHLKETFIIEKDIKIV